MKFVEEQPLAPSSPGREDSPASLARPAPRSQASSAPCIAAAFAAGLLLRSSTARAAAGSLVSVAATLAKPVLLAAGLATLGRIFLSSPVPPTRTANDLIL